MRVHLGIMACIPHPTVAVRRDYEHLSEVGLFEGLTLSDVYSTGVSISICLAEAY